MANAISHATQTPFACHDVLLVQKNLAKMIFFHLLAEQKAATRNLKDMAVEKKNLSRKTFCEIGQEYIRLGKEEKKELPLQRLKDGTRNMEVLRSVCKLWNQIILGDIEFHFFLIFTRAKRFMAEQLLFSRHNFPRVFYDVLGVEALGDPEGVAFTLSQFPLPERLCEYTLLNHVEESVARNRLASAKVMANAMQASREKILALCEIAKIDPKVIQEAKALVSQHENLRWMFGKIAVIEAFHNNLDDASVLANESAREQDYIKIALVAAKHNPDVAKNWAMIQIKKPGTLALAMFEVAIVEGDPTSASEWLSKYEKLTIPFGKNHVLAKKYLKLAKLDQSLGYAKATEYIRALSPGMDQVELYIALAKLDEKPDFTEAKKIAISLSEKKAKRLAVLASRPRSDDDFNDGPYDPEDDEDDPNYMFRFIALAEANYDFEAAIVTAKSITDYKLKEKTISDIELSRANRLFRDDIHAQQVAAMQFGCSDEDKALNLLKVARKDPRHDLTEAKASIGRIKDIVKRVVISCEIAKTVLEIPLDQYKLRRNNVYMLEQISERNKRQKFISEHQAEFNFIRIPRK